MGESMSHRRCSSCGTRGTYPAMVTACPQCEGDLEAYQSVGDEASVEMLIPFPAAQCPVCGVMTLLRRDGLCTACGVELPDEAWLDGDTPVKRRRLAFKRAIERIATRVEDSVIEPSFTLVEHELTLDDYLGTVFRPGLDAIMEISEELRSQLRGVTWDPQADPACVPNFGRIIGIVNRGITFAVSLANQLPPIEVRAIHRILTRTAGQVIHGYVTMMRALIAIDCDEAQDRQRAGQELFTTGARMIEMLPRIMKHASQQASPGWWMSEDTLDLAAIAWEGVDRAPVTIERAATVVRSVLSMIPGITELSDAQALLLLPTTVFSVAVADPVLLHKRAARVCEVLADADRLAPDWIENADELALRIAEGARGINRQFERIGFAAKGPTSRRMTIELLADVYVKLVEGPLRDLGSVVVVAARAARGEPNGRYVPAVARGVQAGDTVKALERLGPPWRGAVRMLMRNAGAHAGVSVEDAGVVMTQRKIDNELLQCEETVTMTDAAFSEEFARLSELCSALQLGIAPWLFTHRSENVEHALRDAPSTRQDREAIVRFLAGLQGLLNVTVGRNGNIVIVQAEPAEGADASSIHIPSLVPAVLHAWNDVDAVTLRIGSREPITYNRTELSDPDPDGASSQDLTAIGLMGRRWLGHLPGDTTIAADIRYVVLPHLATVRKLVTQSITPPVAVSHIADAQARLLALTNRLRRAQLPALGTPLVAAVRESARDAARRLDRLHWAFIGTDTCEQQRQMRSSAALLDRLRDIERRAVAELTRVEPPPTGHSG